MSEYIARVTLAVDGKVIDDFKEVTENEVTRAKTVPLMTKTGTADVLPRYGVSLVYVVPKAGTEYSFAGVRNGTITIVYDGGRVRRYTGVRCLKEGERKADGENEMTQTVEFSAENRL